MMGLYLEEIELGARVPLGSYAFTRANMLAYSRKFDPVGFHVDDDAARASPFGAITAAGLHVACGWMACFVETNSKAREALAVAGKVLPEIGPSPGIKAMRWLKPVYAGDVVSFFTTATAKRALASRPGWGMVSGYNEGVNQHGVLVFSFESAVLTKMKLELGKAPLRPSATSPSKAEGGRFVSLPQRVGGAAQRAEGVFT